MRLADQNRRDHDDSLMIAAEGVGRQELGRFPWLAAFLRRAFFFRDFFAMAHTLVPAGPGRPGGMRDPPVPGVMEYRRTGWWREKGPTMADEIRAEMVANVWKVVKAAGDEVAEGDTLVILESMKMEIPVLAESDGTVTKIAVAEGDVVQEGDLIAVLE